MDKTGSRRFSHVAANAGDAYALIGELLTFKVTNADSGGTFTMVEMAAQPGGGPPLHTHPSSESFTILEGEFEITGLEGGQTYSIRAASGDTVFIPSGAPHAYAAVGDRPSKTMLVFTPGAEMERFFMEAGEHVAAGASVPTSPPDFPAIIAIGEKHGLAFLPPASR